MAWVVTGEIFPLKHRARGLSMTTATNVSLAPESYHHARYWLNPFSGCSIGLSLTRPPTSSTTVMATPTYSPRFSSSGSGVASSASPLFISTSTRPKACRLNKSMPCTKSAAPPARASTGNQRLRFRSERWALPAVTSRRELRMGWRRLRMPLRVEWVSHFSWMPAPTFTADVSDQLYSMYFYIFWRVFYNIQLVEVQNCLFPRLRAFWCQPARLRFVFVHTGRTE